MSTVLHVDDDATNRRLVARILARRPAIELLTAEGGRAGLQLARERRPDLVLSDLGLPDMGGDELVRALQSHPELARIPIVIISGDSHSRRIDDLLDAGAADYVTKPYSLDHLLEVVDRYTQAVDGPPDTATTDPARPAVSRSPDQALAPHTLDRLHVLQATRAPGESLVRDFLRDADRLVARLGNSLAAGDVHDAELAAHNLAGSAGMFAADLVSRAASELEQHLLHGDHTGARATYELLAVEMDRAGTALRSEFPDP